MDMHDQSLQQIGRRRDSRLRLHIPAQLVTIHGNFRAQLLDLSQSGAHLMVEEKLLRGGDAVLSWLNYEAFGRIVRATATQVGLEFDELLPPATLVTTRDLADQNTAKEDKREAFEAARAWYHGYR